MYQHQSNNFYSFADRRDNYSRNDRNDTHVTPKDRRKFQHLHLAGVWRMRDGQRGKERKRREDEYKIEAENSKAKMNHPAGEPSQFSSQFHYTYDDEFFYLSSHVEKSLQEKI